MSKFRAHFTSDLNVKTSILSTRWLWMVIGSSVLIGGCGSDTNKLSDTSDTPGVVQKSASVQPNIIIVMTDDQGYGDLSAHGSPDVDSPNIDHLGNQGVRFTDFHGSPSCAPSRAALMSGKHSFKTGVTHTILERERMALGTTILPEVLKSVGYATSICGKWHLGEGQGYTPQERGFDEVFIHGAGGTGQMYPGSQADVTGNSYFGPTVLHNDTFVKTEGFCTDVFFDQALAWMKQQVDAEKPFFTYIATNAIIYFNSAILSQLLTSFEYQHDEEKIQIVKQASPVAWYNINLKGTYNFELSEKLPDLDDLMSSIEDYKPVQKK